MITDSRSSAPVNRPLLTLGVVLVLSGLFHVAVWLATGAPSLEGPVSWRKPIVFGLSSGIATLSFAWVLTRLPRRPRAGVLAWVYTAAMAVEVGLIDLQAWRGVGSHFNTSTPFDAAVFAVMGVLIAVVSIVVLVWTRWSFGPFAGPADLALATRAAMVLFNVGNLLGGVLIGYGNYQVAHGLTPSLVGAAGQLKLPHGVALHAMQVLPLLAGWLAWQGVPEAVRRGRIRLAIAAYAGLLVVALWQALDGRAPADLTLATTGLTALSLAGLAIAARIPLGRPATPRITLGGTR